MISSRYQSLCRVPPSASATLTAHAVTAPRIVSTGGRICWSGSMVRPSISIMRNPDTVSSPPSFAGTHATPAYSPLYASSFSILPLDSLSHFFTIFVFAFPFSFLPFSSSLPFFLSFFFQCLYIPRARERDKERAFIGRHYERDSPLSK